MPAGIADFIMNFPPGVMAGLMRPYEANPFFPFGIEDKPGYHID